MSARIAKIFRILFTGSAFFVFWWGGLFLSWTVLPALRFRYRRDPREGARRCRAVLNRSLRLHMNYMRFFALIDFDARELVEGLDEKNLGFQGPFVMVANHPSLIDVVLLLAMYPTMYCVVKGEIMHSPFVGRMLQYADHIDAGDGGPISGLQVILGAGERLRGGDPVLIFPEGTRSPRQSLGEFRQGAFVVAQSANLPIVPVHIQMDRPGLMRGMKWYTVPDGTIRYHFQVLPPILPQSYNADPKALAARARDAIAARFPQPRPAAVAEAV